MKSGIITDMDEILRFSGLKPMNEAVESTGAEAGYCFSDAIAEDVELDEGKKQFLVNVTKYFRGLGDQGRIVTAKNEKEAIQMVAKMLKRKPSYLEVVQSWAEGVEPDDAATGGGSMGALIEKRQSMMEAGGGLGSRKKGKKASAADFGKVKVGDLLAQINKQFNATNVLRVTEIKSGPSKGFNAIFVNPDSPKEKRMGSDKEFFVWADDLGNGEYYFLK